MSITATPTAPSTTIEMNGVPVDKLRGTIAKLTENPALAAFEFSAKTAWIEGTASQSTILEWYGAGADQVHAQAFTATSDHPTLGHGHGATPHEFVLHALASCITAGVATTAASREIELFDITATVRGKMDVQGILGIDPDVRNGFSEIEVLVDVQGNADRSDLDALIAASAKRSAVFDILANPTSVDVRPAR